MSMRAFQVLWFTLKWFTLKNGHKFYLQLGYLFPFPFTKQGNEAHFGWFEGLFVGEDFNKGFFWKR